MTEEKLNKVKIVGIISIRPSIEPIEILHKFPNENFYAKFKLHFDRSYFDKDLKEIKGDFYLESSCFVEYEDYLNSIPKSNNQLLLSQLVKINKMIDIIRYSFELSYANKKNHIRNIGKDDFLFYRIDINGQNKVKCFKDNYVKSTRLYKIDKLENTPPFEWSTFMKAIDLLDFGYYNESLIIAFNLIDHCIQITLKSLMANLEDKEKECLLRQIKEQRLKTYLGPLFKSLTGESFYDSKLIEKNVEKINTLRNNIVHSGKDCNYENVCESLKLVHNLIKNLNKKGKQNFKIPDRIIFY